jgi:hypothetical protein
VISAVVSGPLRQLDLLGLLGLPAFPLLRRGGSRVKKENDDEAKYPVLGGLSDHVDDSRQINDLAWASPTAEVGQVWLPEAAC